MNLNNRKEVAGFTLIEILIVIAVLSVIIAISVPFLLRSRLSANEVAAVAALKTIANGQVGYHGQSNPHTFSDTLQKLESGEGAGGVGFIDSSIGRGQKSGYTFKIIPGPVANNIMDTWACTCWPLVYRTTGIRSFYIDDSGIIRGKDNGGVPGDPLMPLYE